MVCLLCLWGSVCTSSAPRLEYQGVVCLLCLWGSLCISSAPRLDYQGVVCLLCLWGSVCTSSAPQPVKPPAIRLKFLLTDLSPFQR